MIGCTGHSGTRRSSAMASARSSNRRQGIVLLVFPVASGVFRQSFNDSMKEKWSSWLDTDCGVSTRERPKYLYPHRRTIYVVPGDRSTPQAINREFAR